VHAGVSGEYKYAAFISYGRADDNKLAVALQDALQRFAKPWYRQRTLRIFRDDASLTANPNLWASIEEALTTSEFLVLLASKGAAESPWVEKELKFWLDNKPHGNILLVITNGELPQDHNTRDVVWGEVDAVPRTLATRYTESPRFVDLRWARGSDQLTLSNPQFSDSVADLAAALHHRAKDEIAGEAIQQYHRTMRVIRATIAFFVVLTLIAVGAAAMAIDRGNQLHRQLQAAVAEVLGKESTSRAQMDPVGATQFALAAWRADPASPSARTALAARYLGMQSVDSVVLDPAAVPVIDFVLSHDGATMLQNHDGGVTVVEDADGQAPRRWPVPGIPDKANVRMSPDGRWLASTDADGLVLIWDIRARSEPRPLDAGLGRSTTISPDLAFSPDGERLGVSGPDPSGTRRVYSMWSTGTGARIPTGFDVVPDPNVSRTWLTADPHQVLLRYGGDETGGVPADDRLELRSLADGRVLRTFPDGSGIARNGELAVTCAVGTAGERGATVVIEVATGRELRRIPVVSDFVGCGVGSSRVGITADRGYLVEGYSSATSTDQIALRLTELETGAAYDLMLPPIATDDTVYDYSRSVRDELRIGVVGEPGRPPTFLARSGAAILQIADPPRDWLTAPDRGSISKMSYDGRYVLYPQGQEIVAIDRATGVEAGRINSSSGAVDDPLMVSGVDDEGFWKFSKPSEVGAWTLETFALPSFMPKARYVFPSRDNKIVAITESGDRLFAMGKGLVSVWDVHTHELVADPLPLGATEEERAAYRSPTAIWPRPQHPDEFAVAGENGAVELWSISRRSRIVTISAHRADEISGTPTGFDLSGNRLATVNDDGAIEVWDVNSGTQLGKPVTAPNVARFFGFTTDGYLVTESSASVVQLWDLDRGVVSGEMRLSSSQAINTQQLLDKDGILALNGVDSMPTQVSMLARSWFDHLCAVADREFTSAELEILPEGTDTSRPCA